MRLDPPTMITSSMPRAAHARRAEHPLDDLRGGVEQITAGRVEVGPADGHRHAARRGAYQHLPGCSVRSGPSSPPRRPGLVAHVRLSSAISSTWSGRELRLQPLHDQVEEALVDIGAAE